MVGYVEKQTVGCGGLRRFDEKTVELKRMYVDPEFRSSGIATQIIEALEVRAVELGYYS